MKPETRYALSPERFEELYKKFWRYVYAICRAALGDTGEAQDAVQEVFLRKWAKREFYDPVRGSFKSWLCTNAMRLCIDRVRRKELESRVTTVGEREAVHTADKVASRVLVESCLSQLPQDQRLFLIMRDVLEFTWEELAFASGLSVRRIRRLVELARSYLRDCLGE